MAYDAEQHGLAQRYLIQALGLSRLALLAAETLWQCAVIHYCKCFGRQGQMRARLLCDEILPAGMPREIHKYFIALRNKHLVHDENAWTQATPMAIVAAASKNRKVEEIVCANITAITRVFELNRDWVAG